MDAMGGDEEHLDRGLIQETTTTTMTRVDEVDEDTVRPSKRQKTDKRSHSPISASSAASDAADLSRGSLKPDDNDEDDDDLSYYLGDGLEDVDWDGVLPEEAERIAECVLSPTSSTTRIQHRHSQQEQGGPPAVRESSSQLPSSPLKACTCTRDLGRDIDIEEEDEEGNDDAAGREVGPTSHSNTAAPKIDETNSTTTTTTTIVEEEGFHTQAPPSSEHDYAEQEAALLERYNLPAHFQRNAAFSSVINQQHHTALSGMACVGFSSAKGKAFTVSKEAIERAALRMNQQQQQQSTTSSPVPQYTDAHDHSRNAQPGPENAVFDTPLPARNRFPLKHLGGGPVSTSSGFKAPTFHTHNNNSNHHQTRPTILPLRFGPKDGHSLLPSKVAEPFETAPDNGHDGRHAGESKDAAAYGISLGSGGAFKMPSKEGVARETSKMDSTGEAQQLDSPSVEPATQHTFQGFTTGSGRIVAMPSKEEATRVARRLDGGDEDMQDPPSQPSGAEVASVLGPRTGNNGSTELAATSQDTNQQPGFRPPTTPSRPPLAAKGDNSTSVSSGFRPPFKTPSVASTLNKPFKLSRPGAPSTPLSHSKQINAVFPQQRQGSITAGSGTPRAPFPKLNMSMTPRNTPSSALNKATFRTPFKNGVRPSSGQLSQYKKATAGTPVRQTEEAMKQILMERTSRGVVPSKGKSTKKKDLRPRRDSVFDLYSEWRALSLPPCL